MREKYIRLVVSGQADYKRKLTEQGTSQAQVAAQQLAYQGVVEIFAPNSSSSSRETAKILSQKTGAAIRTSPLYPRRSHEAKKDFQDRIDSAFEQIANSWMKGSVVVTHPRVMNEIMKSPWVGGILKPGEVRNIEFAGTHTTYRVRLELTELKR